MPSLLLAGFILLSASALMQSIGAHAESFEFVSYVPPAGWQPQNVQDGRAYVRPDGNGIVTFHAGSFDNPNLAFVVTWRELVEPIAPGPAPTPQTQREGDFTVAAGERHGRLNDQSVVASLVTIAGRGHRLAIVGVAGNDQVLRELAAFFDTVTLSPSTSAPAPNASASDLVGRWWKDAGQFNYRNLYYWYEFTDRGLYSYEMPSQERRTGTFSVQGNRLTLTDASGQATNRIFRFECVGGQVRLEISGEDSYWSVNRRC